MKSGQKKKSRRKSLTCESHGFHADVVESVNVYESIKLGHADSTHYIENFKESIRNLVEYGVKVICYNSMPIFDWTHTEMFYLLEDGSTALFFENAKVLNADRKNWSA